MKKVLEIIEMIVLIGTVLMFNIVIGSNDRPLPVVVMAISLLCILICFGIRKVHFKSKIVIKNKLDIAVLIFIIVVLFPLIFRTYCSLEGSILFVLKYFYVYSVYLFVRNVIDTTKKEKIFIIATIISSIIPIIFGIDMLHCKFLNPIVKWLGLEYNESYRFSSTFGYSNAVAIYVTFCIFLTINILENSHKKIEKIFCILYLLLGLYVVYISYSRTVLLLLVGSLFVYGIVKLFPKIKITPKKIITCILICGILFGIFGLYIKIGMKYPSTYENVKMCKFRQKFESGKKYSLYLKLSTNSEDASYVRVVQVNKYFVEKELARTQIDSSKTWQNMEFIPEGDLIYIKLVFDKPDSMQIDIEDCYLNSKEYAFVYKYIPTVISRLVTSFSSKDESIVKRIEYYSNCLRIAKGNYLIGQGGNTWKVLSKTTQSFPYKVKESHSYFFELLISYGIVGVISFLGIVCTFCYIVIKQFIKEPEIRKERLSIFFGIMILLGHSLFFDFNFSFLVILLLFFEYMAIFVRDKNDDIKFADIVDYSVVVLFVITFVMITQILIARYFIKEISKKTQFCSYLWEYRYQDLEDKADKENELEKLMKFMKNEPYKNQEDVFMMYWTQLGNYYEGLSDTELEKYLTFGLNQYKIIKPVSPLYFDTVLQRAEGMAFAIKQLKKIENDISKKCIDELKVMIENEYELNQKNISDRDRNHIDLSDKIDIDKYYMKLLKMVEE